MEQDSKPHDVVEVMNWALAALAVFAGLGAAWLVVAIIFALEWVQS